MILPRPGLARGLPGLLVVLLAAAATATDPRPAHARPPGSEAVFDGPSLTTVTISPDGRFIAAVRHEYDPLTERHGFHVVIRRRGDETDHRVYTSLHQPIRRIDWAGPRTIILEQGRRQRAGENVGGRTATILELKIEGDAVVAEERHANRRGWLVNPLPADDGVVLWAHRRDGASYVHRATLDVLAGPSSNYALRRRRDPGFALAARVGSHVDDWVTDSRGVVRAYVARDEEDEWTYHVGYRPERRAPWQVVWTGQYEDEQQLWPWGLGEDDRRLVVSAYAGHDTRGLHEFDPETGAFTRAIFVHPDVDASWVTYDLDRTEIIAVGYDSGGETRHRYLKAFSAFESSGADDDVDRFLIAGYSRDERHFVLLSRGPADPGTYVLYDAGSGTRHTLGNAVPRLADVRLGETLAVRATSADGTPIEAFLLLPPGEPRSAPPWVVMPHGGPIGVADGADFNPFAQYLALNGFAVLQTNYRGSAGYGRAFEKAGLRAWGKGIEDDIDAAVRAAVSTGRVDPERLCIAGSSYGGYSALISVIRSPGTYRCAATIAGVSDVPLLFQGSDFSMRAAGRRRFAEIAGDPAHQRDEMIEISPVYRVDEIEVPVLIAHGSRDARVDVEHAYRLRQMLEAHDKPHEWLEIDGGTHGPTRDEWIRYGRALVDFLRTHLDEEGARPAALRAHD